MTQLHMLGVQPLLAPSTLIEAQFALQQRAVMACCMLTSATAMSSLCCTATKVELHG